MGLKSIGLGATAAAVGTGAVLYFVAQQSALTADTQVVMSEPAQLEAEDENVAPIYVGDRDSFTTGYRRLTESQYRHTIADVFGPDIAIVGRFEPEQREESLQAVGNARLSVTTSGLEQYYGLARSIADQVVQTRQHEALADCDTTGRLCAEGFIRQAGLSLFRRPLSDADVAMRLAVYDTATKADGSFEEGMRHVLVNMLIAPEFLFRTEVAERVPGSEDYRLDAYSRASRLS